MSAFPLRQEAIAARSSRQALFFNQALRLIPSALFHHEGWTPAWIGVLQRVGLESGVNTASQGRHSVDRLLARLPGQVLGDTTLTMEGCQS